MYFVKNVQWIELMWKKNCHKEGDIEKIVRKYVGDAPVDKARRWFGKDHWDQEEDDDFHKSIRVKWLK